VRQQCSCYVIFWTQQRRRVASSARALLPCSRQPERARYPRVKLDFLAAASDRENVNINYRLLSKKA